jgi:hypothetical protein
VAARSSVIDGYSWPVVLVGTFALFFVLLLLCEINIRRVAQDQKRESLEYFQREAILHAADGSLSARLKMVREEIERLGGGAFMPLMQHALVRSVCLALIAYASTQLIDPASFSETLSGR